MKEAAVVPVDVSTPEEVAPKGNPAVEEPLTPVKPPKVPRPVPPYKYAAAWQCYRPLPSPVHGLSIFARGSLRQTGSAGKTSIWDHELTLKLHTQLGAMTRELCRCANFSRSSLPCRGSNWNFSRRNLHSERRNCKQGRQSSRCCGHNTATRWAG